MDLLHLLFLFRSHRCTDDDRFFFFVRNERGRKMITTYTHTHTHIFAIMIASHSITLLSLSSHLHRGCLSWNLEQQTSTQRERERKRARLDHKLNLHILILIFSCFSMTCVAVSDGFGDSSNAVVMREELPFERDCLAVRSSKSNEYSMESQNCSNCRSMWSESTVV